MNYTMCNQPFKAPPSLDHNSATLLSIWEHHEMHSTDRPIFQYTSGECNESGSVITWGEAMRAMHAAGWDILDGLFNDRNIDWSTDNGERPVIGILAVSDMITAWASVTGIIRAGFIVLLLSPRNSPPALAQLLKSTGCRMLVHSTDKLVEKVLAETLALLRRSGEASMSLCQLPSYDETYGRQHHVNPLPRDSNVHPDDILLITHTSGTTSFPKPRMISHRSFLQFSKYWYNQNIDMSGNVLAMHGLPHFHMMGTIPTLGWTSVSGMVMGVFAPQMPPTVPTPQRVLDAATASQARIMFGVPSFCESWSSDEEAVKQLASFDIIMLGGGPMNRRVGELLVSKGVNIRTQYGTTEIGPVTAYPINIPSKDWEYFKISEHVNAHLCRDEGSEDVYELSIIESPSLRPCAFNTKIDDRPAYASGDLLSRHASNPDLWRIAGRKDDQIMHSNGEKTNPGPIESIIVKHPSVRRLLMFGREQFHPGIIIEPVEDLKDVTSQSVFIDEIWPNVEEANAHAPRHSRLFREMIVIADPAKPLKVTPKQTLRRAEILKDYADEIAEVYRTFQQSAYSVDTACTPNSWNEADCVSFIHAAVAHVLGHKLENDDDFFQNGFNSLEAMYLRSTVTRAIHRADVNISFETRSIYDFPTAASLGKLVSTLAAGNIAIPENIEQRTRQLLKLVKRYTAQFPDHVGTSPLPEQEVILVTGTTGSLGINVLKNLVSIETVQKVYAFNRKKPSGGRNLRDRHLQATRLQGLDESFMDSPKIVYVEGDITLVNMGLPEAVVKQLKNTLTNILHLAWKVDFNMSLNSFAPHFQGVRHLIDLALSSDLKKVPSLVFASSISDLQNLSEAGLIPATINPDPKTAIGMGYGESKWVASRILESAREGTSLKPVIVRIGQLCGNSETGRWNPWEWFPTIVRSARATGCLPELQDKLFWIPVDIAASAIVDLRDVGYRAPVVNLVHRYPVESKIIIDQIALFLGLPVEPYIVWLKCLKGLRESLAADGKDVLERVPALKLLDFYRSLTSEHSEGKKSSDVMQMKLDLSQTVRLSETFSSKGLKPLGESDATRWLKCWEMIS